MSNTTASHMPTINPTNGYRLGARLQEVLSIIHNETLAHGSCATADIVWQYGRGLDLSNAGVTVRKLISFGYVEELGQLMDQRGRRKLYKSTF